jgi:uncharacterized membrane protein YtjA (UPF0391 family)
MQIARLRPLQQAQEGQLRGNARWHGTWSIPGDVRHLPRDQQQQERTMLHYTIIFLVVAIIAAVLGFGGIAGAAAGIAKILFFVFLVLFAISLFTGRKAV